MARSGNSDLLVIGRQRESASIWSALESALNGRLAVTFITGEPGIGKTCLLDSIAGRAAQTGAKVLRGGASEAEGMPSYLPFLEALGQHIRVTSPDTLQNQSGAFASVLASILPELTLRLGERPVHYPLPPEQARLRLYEAVGTFVAAIAAADGLLLILDDLQWADPASLDLLCYVVRQQPAARLLVLGAYRAGEVADNPAFERALAELNRLRTLNTVKLTPLTDGDITALAASYLSAPVDQALSQQLWTHSEGNPFFAEELLRSWLETGVVVQDNAQWILMGPGPTAPVPGIVSAVRQRLTRLAPHVIDLLRTAAIIGRTFDEMLLADVLGQEVEVVEEALQQAVLMHLIHVVDPGIFTFSHDQIRECLYEEVTPARRQRLHGFIGRALRMQQEENSAQQLAMLAFHFARSGDRTQGTAYSIRAAEQALHSFAPDEALTHYRTAVKLIDSADPRRGHLLLCLGEAALLANAEQEAVSAFQAAQTWFQQAGDIASAARAAHRLGQAYWRQETLPATRAAFETALSLLKDQPGPTLVQVLMDLSSLLAVSLHLHEESIVYARQALELAQRIEDAPLLAGACRTLGNLLVRSNDFAAGIPLLEQALDLASTADDLVEASECCACLTIAYFWQGKFRRFHDILMKRLKFAERSHDSYQLRHVYTWLAAYSALCLGQWSEAERLLDEAQATVERLASPEPRGYLLSIRGFLSYFRGDYALAESQSQEAIAIFRGIGPGTVVWYLGELAMIQAELGKATEARRTVNEIEALLAAYPEGPMLTAEVLTGVVLAALQLGDPELLARFSPRLVPFRGQFHGVLVDRLLGETASLQRDWETAQAYLESAETSARQAGLPWEVARTLEAHANLTLAQGGRGSTIHAQELLAEAVRLYQQYGFQADERRLDERLHTFSQQHPPKPQLPAGVTAREAEVLRLVADGKSNRQIAEDLVLSERTVENHLTNIYNKIGVDNRAAATAFAVRHGLV
jgi:predicted ATPase/DNA-binding CsgD family transcriptional regulator